MIKIITGRQTDPLQEKILEEAVENYQKHPEHETFIIVPNHIKFTTEVRAINKLAINQQTEHTSVKNLQVLSFSRLAWYFMKDAEKGLPTQLDNAACAMLISQIINQKNDELILFHEITANSGLTKQIYQTILEIYEGNIDLDDLETQKLDLETKNKIHDLKIIYQAFLAAIEGKFSTKNEIQLQLNKLIAESNKLKQASFYFVDFSHFSLQESLTIKLLFKKAANVTCAFKTKNGELNPDSQAGDYDYVIQKTIKQLTTYLDQQSIPYSAVQYPLAKKLSSKEKLNGIWTQTLPNLEELDQVQLVKADTRYSEAYFVARTIYQQVALSNYRYQDFLVLAPNLHEYETYLIPILRQNKIPFFNDLQKEMKYHPLVIFIENLSQILIDGLTTQNLLIILKTRLLIPDYYQDEASYLSDVDQLENFVLAHGINHNLWQYSFEKFLTVKRIKLDQMPDRVAKIDKLRQFLLAKIDKLKTQLEQAQDSREAITSFFTFLTENGISQRLETWRKEANDHGDLQSATQPEQLWNLLIQLLKDYLLINPEKFDLSKFFSMLNQAFKEANFSQIPSTIDAVNLSEMGMVQSSGYKQVFILGATSTGLPQIQKTPGFLSSENLAQLETCFDDDQYLEDRQNLNNLDQDYQFGLSLSLASDRVYLSYPVLNANNEELEPSIFYERLKNAGAIELCQHDLPDKSADLLQFMTTCDASVGYLTYLNSIDKQKQISTLLALAERENKEKTQAILTASLFDNQPEIIGPNLAQKLYGNDLNSSVSQLETYYQNSFEYFLIYGLKLRKRFENELDVIQAGNYFHETFDRLVKVLTAKKLDLAKIDQVKLETLLGEIRSKMKEQGKYQQLMNDPFNQFLFKCLDQTTSKVANHWQNILRKTPLRAQFSELSFGLGEKLAGLNYDLPNLSGKHQARMRGKIDRVDLAKTGTDQALAQVIDYKSSAKQFDFGLFYQGISLQMISYLAVVNQSPQFFHNKELDLLGAFYQTVTQKVAKLNSKTLFDKDLNVKENALSGKTQLKYNGIISNDPELLKKAQPLLTEPSQMSDLYGGVKTKKSGFSLPKANFSADELNLLLEYNDYLIKKAAEQILGGQIALNPFKYGNNKNALTYSDYRDIYFFDAMLAQNKYHEISHLEKKDLLTLIKKDLENKEL